MPAPTAAGRYAFRASKCDIHNVETIAQALRASGKAFPTRSEVIRVCLAVAAADTALILAATAR
jgi:hypothetical protein